MPRGPHGEWRPAGDNEAAGLICRIATGESPEVYEPPPDAASRKNARRTAKARATSLTPERRTEVAQDAAQARWAKEAGEPDLAIRSQIGAESGRRHSRAVQREETRRC